MYYGSGTAAHAASQMTSHVLSGLVNGRQSLLHMQHRMVGGRHGCHLKSMMSHPKSDTVNQRVFMVLEEQS